MAKKTKSAGRPQPKAARGATKQAAAWKPRRATVHPERPIQEAARVQRRAVTAVDVPGSTQQATRNARRHAAITAASRGIKVQAKQDGYYGHIRRRAGTVFTIRTEEEFSSKWMRRVDPRKRESIKLSNDVIREKHDETLAMRHGVADPGRAVPGDDGDDIDEGEEQIDDDPLGAGD